MKKNIKTYESYVASFNIEEGIYGITFYDFPGCVSVGDDMKKAIYNANEALQGHVDCMIERGHKLPSPTDLNDIITEEGKSDLHILVEVKIKTVKRIDVTISEDLIRQIDEVSHNRSRFIEEASLYYLNKS